MNVRRSAHMNVMVDAAEKAGRGLVRDFGEVENLQVSRKGPGNFVSAADHKAEKTIRDILLKGRPNYSFLMEEAGAVKGSDTEHRWIIDPLDGTTNFLHGVPHWSVAIALEKNGEIVAGVVYDPIKDEMYWAEKGIGASMNNRRLQVAARTALNDALVTTCPMPETQDVIASLHARGTGVRSYGSACLDLCYVAAGRMDAYFEAGLQPWDKAAGMLIAREARAVVTELDGGSNVVMGKGILAANSAIHAELLKEFKKDRKVKTAS